MQIVVDAIIFFGMSSDDVIDPDTATSQLEEIGSTLRNLNSSERDEFIRYVDKVTLSEEDAQRVEFLATLCENIGG